MSHIIWLVQKKPDYEFWIGPFVEVKVEDRDAYLAIRRVWEDVLQTNPQSASILSNAADFMLYHDPEFSRELYRKAIKSIQKISEQSLPSNS